MTLKDDLIAAKALIDTPEKCACGVKKTGISLNQAVDNAVSEFDDEAYREISRAVQTEVGHNIFFVDWSWEISRTHADIMALFDRAIAAAGEPS